jgi:hypothetical protein
MTDSDVAGLVGYFLSAFAVGLLSSYLLKLFIRLAGFIR